MSEDLLSRHIASLSLATSGKIGLHLRVSRSIEPRHQPDLLPRSAKTISMLLIRSDLAVLPGVDHLRDVVADRTQALLDE